MMTPLHPQTVSAINTMIAPAFQVIVALAFACIIAAWAYRFRIWLKDRREDREPTQFKHEWEATNGTQHR